MATALAEAAEYEAMEKEGVAATQPHWTARKSAAEGDAERLAADRDSSWRRRCRRRWRSEGRWGSRCASSSIHELTFDKVARDFARRGGAGGGAGGGAAAVWQKARDQVAAARAQMQTAAL